MRIIQCDGCGRQDVKAQSVSVKITGVHGRPDYSRDFDLCEICHTRLTDSCDPSTWVREPKLPFESSAWHVGPDPLPPVRFFSKPLDLPDAAAPFENAE